MISVVAGFASKNHDGNVIPEGIVSVAKPEKSEIEFFGLFETYLRTLRKSEKL